MKPAQVLDVAATLRDHLRGSLYRDYLGSVYASEVHDSVPAGVGDALAEDETRRLEHGYAHHVHADMTPLVTAAAAGLDDDDPWTPDLPPTPVGYALFDTSLPGVDVRGANYPTKMVTWRTATTPGGRPGLWLSMYVSHSEVPLPADDGDAEYVRQFRRSVGDLQFAQHFLARWGDPVGPATRVLDDEQVAHVNRTTVPVRDGHAVIPSGATVQNATRGFYALFAIMRQTVTDVSEGEVPPGVARRSARRRIPPRVTVIRLRRASTSTSEEHHPVDWAYRTIVRGHWRRYAVGPGRVDRRLVWVHPYVRGPEDKPLHVPERVYTLNR